MFMSMVVALMPAGTWYAAILCSFLPRRISILPAGLDLFIEDGPGNLNSVNHLSKRRWPGAVAAFSFSGSVTVVSHGGVYYRLETLVMDRSRTSYKVTSHFDGSFGSLKGNFGA
ncbi:hypothetical protein GGS20DRAFT_350261 [Poronia punctata]|nr:hypothetical protein GGS20DRAFT_350261 [Poronia punctata]